MFALSPLTTEAQLADHTARLVYLETAQRTEKEDRQKALENQAAAHQTLADKVDALKNWIMATLGTAMVGLLVQVLTHLAPR